ncbi:MAG TPA: hypothetical protein VJK54_07575 [Chthoniobacterales bacterium]|nr:hypothetical protein [Chthoniobacterales bacterium]
MKTHPFLTAALLTLLHNTTTFAMDPQEAKGIIGELEQFCGNEVNQVEQTTAVTTTEVLTSAEYQSSSSTAIVGKRKREGEEDSAKIPVKEDDVNQSISEKDLPDFLKLSVETDVAGKESESISLNMLGKSLQAMADYQAKASEAEETGKATLAAGYREASTISEEAAHRYKQSVALLAEEKEDESDSFSFEGNALQLKADYQVRALEAEEKGEITLAAAYREAAVTSQEAADQSKLAILAYAEGKERKGDACNLAGESFQLKVGYQIKALEAEEAGKTSLAVGYREAAATSQEAADQNKIAVLAYTEGKEREGDIYNLISESFQAKADYQTKTIAAKETGKTSLEAGYREVVATFQRAADQRKQAVQAYLEGKKSEANNSSWKQY